MVGKGQRRREKNYRSAHGGEARLPPPPKQRELDALPSKLRRLIAIQNKQNGGGKAGADASSGELPVPLSPQLRKPVYPANLLPPLTFRAWWFWWWLRRSGSREARRRCGGEEQGGER